MKVKKQKKRSRLDPRDFVLKMGFSLAGGQGWEGEKCLQQNGGRKGLLPTKRFLSDPGPIIVYPCH